MVDALTQQSDEGRGIAAIRSGEMLSNLRSGDFRIGKPKRLDLLFCYFADRVPREVKHFSTWRKRKQSRKRTIS